MSCSCAYCPKAGDGPRQREWEEESGRAWAGLGGESGGEVDGLEKLVCWGSNSAKEDWEEGVGAGLGSGMDGLERLFCWG
jgi:hypothetical protein